MISLTSMSVRLRTGCSENGENAEGPSKPSRKTTPWLWHTGGKHCSKGRSPSRAIYTRTFQIGIMANGPFITLGILENSSTPKRLETMQYVAQRATYQLQPD